MAEKVVDNKDKKPVRVPEHLAAPHNPNNIRLKKEDFVKQERERKERDLKVSAYKKSLDEEVKQKLEKPIPEKDKSGKPARKPKNIE